MPSRIDPNHPATGVTVSKAAQRANWAAAKAEIEHGGFIIDPTTGSEAQGATAVANVLGAATRVFATIAEMQSWAPLPGRAAFALGYATAGDGGGGLFRASTGAEVTDGGTVFGATADESAVQTHTVNTSINSQAFLGLALPHQDIVFGSVEVDYGDGTVVGDVDMHGHHWTPTIGGLVPRFDHATGTFTDSYTLLGRRAFDHGITSVDVRYKYLTTNRRWVRVVDGDALHLKWFGAVEGQDARNLICWALNAAASQGRRRLALHGDFFYLGAIEVPDGLEITDGKLTVMGGNAAVAPYRLDRPNPPTDPLAILDGDLTVIQPDNGSTYAGFRRLELDGNWQNNREPWDNPGLYDFSLNAGTGEVGGALADHLRNTPFWNGFNNSIHGNRVIPEGQEIVMEDVHIHDFGGSCILGSREGRWRTRNLSVGNSLHNHCFYGCSGEHQGFTVYGFCRWGYVIVYDNTFQGVRVENLAPNPMAAKADYRLLGVFNYRGTDNPGLGFRITDWVADVGGADEDQFGLFSGEGPGFKIGPGTLIGSETAGKRTTLMSTTYDEAGPGGTDQVMNSGTSVSDVVLLERGAPVTPFGGFLAPFQVRNLSRAKDVGQADHADAPEPFLHLAAIGGNTGGYTRRQRVLLSGITNDLLNNCLLELSVDNATAGDAVPMEVTVRDSRFRISEQHIFKARSGALGTLASVPDAPDKFFVAMENVLIDVERPEGQEDWYAEHLELFFRCSRFRNVRMWGSYTSEDGGIHTETAAASQSIIEIPTNLIWVPERKSNVRLTARNAATATVLKNGYHITYRDQYGVVVDWAFGDNGQGGTFFSRGPTILVNLATPLAGGEAIDVDWTAAVRPF